MYIVFLCIFLYYEVLVVVVGARQYYDVRVDFRVRLISFGGWLQSKPLHFFKSRKWLFEFLKNMLASVSRRQSPAYSFVRFDGSNVKPLNRTVFKCISHFVRWLATIKGIAFLQKYKVVEFPKTTCWSLLARVDSGVRLISFDGWLQSKA